MTDDQLPYINEIPEEYKSRGAEGTIYLSEFGVIHLCTIVEQRHPEKAALAANLRRSTSAQCQQMRQQAPPS